MRAASLGRVWKHHVSYQDREVGACGDELAQRAHGRPVRVELFHREAVLRVRTAEVREAGNELPHHLGVDRVVDPRPDLDVTCVEPFLPCGRWRDDGVRAYELAPMHVIAECRRQQPQPVATLAEDAVRLLEYGHPCPLQVARIDG